MGHYPVGMSEPPNQRPVPEAYPPQNYPPQNYPPQNYPPQGYPPQNYPPQNPQNQPYPPNPAAPYPVQPQYRLPRKPSEELRRDAEAALAARMELGPEYNEYVAAGLAERVEELAEVRAAELRQQALDASRAQAAEQGGRGRQFALAVVSMVMGIPITAITATNVDPGLLGVAVSWAGIVGVNWVHARSLRKRK
jgi:XYPPX repeat (two copies)